MGSVVAAGEYHALRGPKEAQMDFSSVKLFRLRHTKAPTIFPMSLVLHPSIFSAPFISPSPMGCFPRDGNYQVISGKRSESSVLFYLFKACSWQCKCLNIAKNTTTSLKSSKKWRECWFTQLNRFYWEKLKIREWASVSFPISLFMLLDNLWSQNLID